MINPTTDAISEFAAADANASGFDITAGPDGNLWFTETGTGSIGDDQPDDRCHHRVPRPLRGANPVGITAGPDGNIWFTDSGTNAIGVATLTTSQLVVTQQPPASVTAGSAFRPDGRGRGQLGQPRSPRSTAR